MTSELPLEVLGLVAPVLSWVEGLEGVRLPQNWLRRPLTSEQRVISWLNRELPTYSHDNLDEIWWLARNAPPGRERPGRRPKALQSSSPQRSRGRRRAVAELDPPDGYSLRLTFDRLADRYLLWSGNELAIQAGRVEEFHELALRFPVGHLIRHRHARAVATGLLRPEEALRMPDDMSRLHTTSQGIRAVVERGLTEGHLHLWGVLGANEAWADHLLAPATADALQDLEDDERHLLTLSRWTVRMLALGLLHAALELDGEELPFDLIPLFDRLYTSRPGTANDLRDQLRRRLTEAVVATPPPRRTTEPGVDEVDWLLELIDPTVHLVHFGHRPRPGRGTDGDRVGIRRRIRRLQRLHVTVHRRITELDVDRPGETESALWRFLHDLYYRYLILHTHHWHLAVQSGKTTGLRQFKRYYSARQRRPFVSDLEVQGLVNERLRRSPDLRVVEGRVSTPRSPAELVPWILGYAQARKHREIEKFGLVVHFLKGPKGEVGETAHPLRHSAIRRETRRRALRLYQLLSQPHPAVPFVVGIDAANLELTTPPEVFAPAFRFLREYPIPLRRSALAGQSLSCYREIAELVRNRSLGMTFHVGEDFRHLLSGLRAIDEVIAFLDPRPGDRLGHAIALALDPEVWASQLGYQAVVPQQEALDTLVWLFHLLGPGHGLLSDLRIEEWIQQLGRLIYGRGPAARTGKAPHRLQLSPRVLFDAMRLRQLDPLCLDDDALLDGRFRIRDHALGDDLPHRRWRRAQEDVHRQLHQQIGSDDAYRLLWMHWHDPEVRRAGNRIIPVDMARNRRAWRELCHGVQERMRSVVERRQLVVEVNPSSNRIVGAMPRLREHHIFRLTLDADHRPIKKIRVTINTDDPGVFNTSLAHEYYLLAEILHDRGVPEPRIVEWLEWLRCNGNDYSFVRTLPDLDDPNVERLLEELERTHPTFRHRLEGRIRRPRVRGRNGDRKPVARSEATGREPTAGPQTAV